MIKETNVVNFVIKCTCLFPSQNFRFYSTLNTFELFEIFVGAGSPLFKNVLDFDFPISTTSVNGNTSTL